MEAKQDAALTAVDDIAVVVRGNRAQSWWSCGKCWAPALTQLARLVQTTFSLVVNETEAEVPVHVIVLPQDGSTTKKGTKHRALTFMRKTAVAVHALHRVTVLPCCDATQLLSSLPQRLAMVRAPVAAPGFTVNLPGPLLKKIAPLMVVLLKLFVVLKACSGVAGMPVPLDLLIPVELREMMSDGTAALSAIADAFKAQCPPGIVNAAGDAAAAAAAAAGSAAATADSESVLRVVKAADLVMQRIKDAPTASAAAEAVKEPLAVVMAQAESARVAAYRPAHSTLKEMLQNRTKGKWQAAVDQGHWRQVYTTAEAPAGEGGQVHWVCQANFQLVLEAGVATASGNAQIGAPGGAAAAGRGAAAAAAAAGAGYGETKQSI